MPPAAGKSKQMKTMVPRSQRQAYDYFCNVKQFRRFLIADETTDEGGEWVVTETASREPKPRTTEDSYFAETLSTARTVPHLLTVYWSPSSPLDEPPKPGWPTITEIRVMAAVGDGVNGYPHIAHGGFLATLLDELPGVLVMLNTAQFTPFTSAQQPLREPSATGAASNAAANTLPHSPGIRIIPPTTDMLTASLKVQYLRSVHTPCNLLISVKIVDVVTASPISTSTSTTKAAPQTASGGGGKPRREKLVYTLQTAASNGVQGEGEVVYARGEAVWVGVPRLDRGDMQRGGARGEKGKL